MAEYKRQIYTGLYSSEIELLDEIAKEEGNSSNKTPSKAELIREGVLLLFKKKKKVASTKR